MTYEKSIQFTMEWKVQPAAQGTGWMVQSVGDSVDVGEPIFCPTSNDVESLIAWEKEIFTAGLKHATAGVAARTPRDLPDTQRGLYRKYELRKIERTPRWEDGRFVRAEDSVPTDGEFFALRETDPFAPSALREYASVCKYEYRTLAEDLEAMAQRWENKNT